MNIKTAKDISRGLTLWIYAVSIIAVGLSLFISEMWIAAVSITLMGVISHAIYKILDEKYHDDFSEASNFKTNRYK